MNTLKDICTEKIFTRIVILTNLSRVYTYINVYTNIYKYISLKYNEATVYHKLSVMRKNSLI